MKRYKLKKDLPTFNKGDEFFISPSGNLVKVDYNLNNGDPYGTLCAYSCNSLQKFPNILIDWFEEIPEKPKTVWDLEKGDEYLYIDWDSEIVITSWESYSREEYAREMGNCFLTKEEAEKEIAWRKAKQILLQDTKGFEPDWSDEDEERYDVTYDYDRRKFLAAEALSMVDHRDVWFASEEDAKASIKKHEKEWKIYLGVEQ